MRKFTPFRFLALNCLAWLSSLSLPGQASHLVGGELTFHADTTHTSPLRYFFKLVLYQDQVNSAADDQNVRLNFGDGTTAQQQRHSKTTLVADRSIARSVFYFQHDYPAAGSYTVSFLDSNRGMGFVNVESPQNIPFFIQATVRIGHQAAANHSPLFLAPFISTAGIRKTFRHNITAYDPDGDSVAYKLVPILQATGQPVASYQFPDTITIDNRSGEMVWKQPEKLGRYAFAVEVREYRQKQLIGKVMRDFIVNTVAAAPDLQMEIQHRAALPVNERSQLFAPANVPLKIQVSATPAAGLEAYSELFRRSRNITSQTAISGNQRVYELTISPEASLLRSLPYIITFRGTAASGTTQQDLTLAIYFRPERASDQQDTTEPGGQPDPEEEPGPDGEAQPWAFTLYPNPVATYFKVDNNKSIPSVLHLYNASSQLMLVQTLSLKQTFVQRGSPLKAGVYFYVIFSEQENLAQTGKLVLF